MLGFSFLDLSSFLGLSATFVLTFNIILGMLLSTAYARHPWWKRLPVRIKQINVNDLHNWTAYVALLLVLLHPLLLLFDPATKFKFIDIIFPIHAPNQKLFVAFGTLSMFAIIVVLITTQKIVKKKMSYRAWKNIHLVSYGTALLFLIHGMVIDQTLKDQPLDLLDAEKMVSEACLVIIVIAGILRYRYHRIKAQQ